MKDVRFFAGLFQDLPVEFLLRLDENLRLLAKTNACHVELANATNGAISYQLPDGTLHDQQHHIVKVDSSGNAVTIYPAVGQTIRNTTSLVLSARYDVAHLAYVRATADWVTL